MAVLDLAALAEERVGLVEEEDRAAILGGIEEAAQVLLRLADIFADHRREVDAVEIEAQAVGDDLGSHRLARAAFSGEQGVDAQAAIHLVGKAPFLVDRIALLHLRGYLVQAYLSLHRVAPDRPMSP